MEPSESATIVRRAREGDRDAWEQLVAEYTGMLRGVARRYRLDEAQQADVVQITWLRLFEHLDDLRDLERLPGWLATTARRTCLEVLRGSKREQPVEFLTELPALADPRYPGTEEDTPERSAVRHEHQAIVRHVLAELPEEQQRLMTLLHTAPAPSYQQVSVQLGMPIGSIGPTRARILAKLRTLLVASELQDLALS